MFLCLSFHRKDIAMHMEVCSNRVVECAVPGCKFVGTRLQIEEHERASMVYHNKLLVNGNQLLVSMIMTKVSMAILVKDFDG